MYRICRQAALLLRNGSQKQTPYSASCALFSSSRNSVLRYSEEPHKSVTEESPSPSFERSVTRNNKNFLINKISTATDLNKLFNTCQGLHYKNPIAIKVVVDKIDSLLKENVENVEPMSIGEESEFKRLIKAFDYDFTVINPQLISQILGKLLNIFPMDTPELEAIFNRCLWAIPRMTCGVLVDYVRVLDDHQETEFRKKLLKSTLESVEKRINDIMSPYDIVYLLGRTNSTPSLRKASEEQALVLTSVMSCRNLYKVLIYLSNTKSRNPKLIQSIVYCMNQLELDLGFKQLQNMLFACCSLKVYNVEFLQRISKSVMENIHSDNRDVKLIGNIATSVGVLRYYHQELYDVLIGFFKANLNGAPKELASIILSSARVNLSLTPEQKDDLKKIATGCEPLKNTDPSLWLEVVWSEVVLGTASDEHIESVLEDYFIDKCTTDGLPAYKVLLNQQKICQIQSSVSIADSYKHQFELPDKVNRQITNAVVKALENFVPGDRYLRKNVSGRGGCQIDAEFVVNKDGAPQPLQDFPSPLSYDPSPVAIAEELNWVALRVYDFQDLSLRHVGPTGIHVLSTKILTNLGYKVVEVPHRVFVTKETVVQQVQYLQEKIKEAIADNQ